MEKADNIRWAFSSFVSAFQGSQAWVGNLHLLILAISIVLLWTRSSGAPLIRNLCRIAIGLSLASLAAKIFMEANIQNVLLGLASNDYLSAGGFNGQCYVAGQVAQAIAGLVSLVILVRAAASRSPKLQESRTFNNRRMPGRLADPRITSQHSPE